MADSAAASIYPAFVTPAIHQLVGEELRASKERKSRYRSRSRSPQPRFDRRSPPRSRRTPSHYAREPEQPQGSMPGYGYAPLAYNPGQLMLFPAPHQEPAEPAEPDWDRVPADTLHQWRVKIDLTLARSGKISSSEALRDWVDQGNRKVMTYYWDESKEVTCNMIIRDEFNRTHCESVTVYLRDVSRAREKARLEARIKAANQMVVRLRI